MTFTLILVLLAACKPASPPGSDTALARAATPASGEASAPARHILETCAEGDSVVFSTVELHEETGDINGIELTLRRVERGWTGSGREAEGDFGRATPLAGLRLIAPDSLVLAMPHDAGEPTPQDTLFLRGRVTCEHLEGSQQEYRHLAEEAVRYRRHRLPRP